MVTLWSHCPVSAAGAAGVWRPVMARRRARGCAAAAGWSRWADRLAGALTQRPRPLRRMWRAATRLRAWSTLCPALAAGPWARSTRPTCGRWDGRLRMCGVRAAVRVCVAACVRLRVWLGSQRRRAGCREGSAGGRGGGALRVWCWLHVAMVGRQAAQHGGGGQECWLWPACLTGAALLTASGLPPSCLPGGAQVGQKVRAKRKEDQIPLNPFTAGENAPGGRCRAGLRWCRAGAALWAAPACSAAARRPQAHSAQPWGVLAAWPAPLLPHLPLPRPCTASIPHPNHHCTSPVPRPYLTRTVAVPPMQACTSPP